MEKNPKIAITVAISSVDYGIGKNGKLLWHIPEDLKRFNQITRGHPVIMGRKTFESIVGYIKKPLPHRTNIVVTRDTGYTSEFPEVIVTHSFEDALKRAEEIDANEIHIAGGSEIYKEALPFATHLYLTLIDDQKEADSFFPPYEAEFAKETLREEHVTKDGLKYTFLNLERT